jgi:thiamine biosynthesis lipoprotein
MHMGTTVEITVVARDKAAGEAAIAEGFAEVERLEQVFSSYRADSELSSINARSGRGPVAASGDMVDLVGRAVAIARETGGAFNPLMGPAIKLWGIPEHPRVPSDAELERLRPLVEVGGVTVAPRDGTLTLARPGMALGLGGIAKGYTADRVAALLKARGIGAGIVAVAGDLRVFGTRPDGRPWRVGVRHPRRADRPMAALLLTDAAVSTSGDYERFFEVDGKRYHHILDPRTLKPAAETVAVTVLARDGTTADGLATALFVMGPEAGLKLVERLQGVEALFAAPDGKVTASSGWPGPAPPDLDRA